MDRQGETTRFCPRVCGFLRQHKAAILAAWEARVSSEPREIELTGLALRDDIPALLDELAAWIESDAAPDVSLLQSRAFKHVMQRLDQGVKLAQVYREYRLLRETLIEEVLGAETAEQQHTSARDEADRVARIEELARLNAGLENVLSQSIIEFIEERDRRAAAERSRLAEAERASEARYRWLFESMDEGFCIIEVLFKAERAVDYRFLQVNPAFERQTGLANATGQCIRDMVNGHEEHWFETYGQVALTGQPARFENAATALGCFYEVYAFRVGEPGQNQVAVLFNDITERKAAEEDLRLVNLQLAEADQRKNDFLAVLSHELRNPLAPVANSLYILDHAPPGSDQAIRAKQVISRQVAQLSNLVNDLLDVTRITRNKVKLQQQRIDLGETVGRAVEDNRSLFEQAGVWLDLALAPQPVWLLADRTRLMQIIGNVLQNSAKFTPKGGHTRISVTVEGGQAVVRVADDGDGMSAETLARLFQPFEQAVQSIERTQGGLGLGLALVKGLVELHGGTVSAHSDGLGRGTEFVVRMPVCEGAAADVTTRARASRVRRRVLIIEDNADAADSLSEALSIGEHDVAVAYNGPEGIAKARTFRPEIVLCDIGLPKMSGYEVARAFRADEDLKGAFLVALSGYALPEDRQRASEAGFDQHVAKPPNLEKLDDLLCSAIPDRASGTALVPDLG